MATKIFLIAVCVLAVTANVVPVAQDQDDGYEHEKTDYELKKIDYEPKETDYEPKETDYEPNETDDEPKETDYEPKKTDYEPKKTDYEPKKTDYEPKKTNYRPKRVICLGVDVTNNCIHRADGYYAIDIKPRSSYVACVNKRTMCMPCPYGLVFCPKAGYRGFGLCLRKYECSPY